MMTTIYKGDNLYAKVRYNIQHGDTDLRWRMFIKDGDKEEIMVLCRDINFYKPGRTYSETIGGAGHYSILVKADKIVIDEMLVGYIM